MSKKVKLTAAQRNRLAKLLNMPYTVRELAGEIGIEVYPLYKGFITMGCPKERNGINQITINGRAFRDWYEQTLSRPTSNPIQRRNGKPSTLNPA